MALMTGGRGTASSATVTLDEGSSSSTQPLPQQVLTLRLAPRRQKKKVTWKEGTVDNEFMNKKSSKQCCIFHKDKPFDEDDSGDEDSGKTKEGPKNGMTCDRGLTDGHRCSHQH